MKSLQANKNQNEMCFVTSTQLDFDQVSSLVLHNVNIKHWSNLL